MKLTDLCEVIEIHKNCFPSSLSIFTALGDNILKLFYTQAVTEQDNIAIVLEDLGSKHVIAFAIGTMTPGFRQRLVKHNLLYFTWALFCGLLLNHAVRERTQNYMRLLKKKFSSKSCSNSTYLDSTPPVEPEGNYMIVAVHQQARRKGNAKLILHDLVRRIFEAGANRVRARVRTDNLPSINMHKQFG